MSLFLRNLLFTILQPGVVVGLVPFFILRNRWVWPAEMHLHHLAGIVLFIVGFIVMTLCIARFATEGRGTLSPLDPTKRVVTGGLYAYSRNPMYVGVMGMLVGEGLFMSSSYIWVYVALVFVAFNIFIFVHEEPRMRRDFGEEYQQYCRKVRRWI